jgi:hypothetical protein
MDASYLRTEVSNTSALINPPWLQEHTTNTTKRSPERKPIVELDILERGAVSR